MFLYLFCAELTRDGPKFSADNQVRNCFVDQQIVLSILLECVVIPELFSRIQAKMNKHQNVTLFLL